MRGLCATVVGIRIWFGFTTLLLSVHGTAGTRRHQQKSVIFCIGRRHNINRKGILMNRIIGNTLCAFAAAFLVASALDAKAQTESSEEAKWYVFIF